MSTLKAKCLESSRVLYPIKMLVLCVGFIRIYGQIKLSSISIMKEKNPMLSKILPIGSIYIVKRNYPSINHCGTQQVNLELKENV